MKAHKRLMQSLSDVRKNRAPSRPPVQVWSPTLKNLPPKQDPAAVAVAAPVTRKVPIGTERRLPGSLHPQRWDGSQWVNFRPAGKHVRNGRWETR